MVHKEKQFEVKEDETKLMLFIFSKGGDVKMTQKILQQIAKTKKKIITYVVSYP